MDQLLEFVYDKKSVPIIKVIGIGGGGGNAVEHMYNEGIKDVAFALCNTDYQALAKSQIPTRIQLGKKGLGAGNRPIKAKEAAEETLEKIEALLSDGTEMTFITAGMGGGTGTGAAPVIAKKSKELGILTVGIVTIPFMFESRKKIFQALDGVEEMSKYVDALLVINNERLRDIYPDLDFLNAFAKADDTLTNAAKSIAELITVPGYINLDFADVSTTLLNGGVAVMSSGFGEGEGRIGKSINDALNSPLLNNNNIYSARKVLINLYFSQNNQVKMDEMSDIHKFMENFNSDVEVIWGAAFDNELENRVKITILATGFEVSAIPGLNDTAEDRAIFRREQEAGYTEEQEKRNAINIKRMEDYYGHRAESITKTNRRQMVVMNIEQMDDDVLIEQLELMPVYKRDVKALNQYFEQSTQSSAKTAVVPEQTPLTKPNTPTENGGGTVIRFN